MKEKDWMLLNLYFSKAANEEQINWVLRWKQESAINRQIFNDVQRIMKRPSPLPVFDSQKAFKKLDKKLQSR